LVVSFEDLDAIRREVVKADLKGRDGSCRLEHVRVDLVKLFLGVLNAVQHGVPPLGVVMAKAPMDCLTLVRSPNGSQVAFRRTVEAVASHAELLRERRSRTGLVDAERKRWRAGC